MISLLLTLSLCVFTSQGQMWARCNKNSECAAGERCNMNYAGGGGLCYASGQGPLAAAWGRNEYLADRLDSGRMKAGRSSGCDFQCAGQGTMEGYNTCVDNCDRFGGYGREYHDFLTDSFNCMDGCRSITDATAYDACAKACFADNPMAMYQGRRYEETVFSRRQAEVAASRQSKPFWEQNAIPFAIIFAAIASVAGLTYCLYEKKKVKKQVDAEGRDSVYTSITA